MGCGGIEICLREGVLKYLCLDVWRGEREMGEEHNHAADEVAASHNCFYAGMYARVCI
jgi:hypothetical protein